MRPVHLVRLDKVRPAVLLTREAAAGSMSWVTVAPVTSTVKGIATEVAVGRRNGLDHEGVISCDNVVTVEAAQIGRRVGLVLDDQEVALARAIVHAYDLRVEAMP